MNQLSGPRRFLAFFAIATLFYCTTPSARACPLCKFANEEKQGNEEVNRRPKAYMYSILFMLSMPATLLGGFGFGFYRLWKQQQLTMSETELPGAGDDAAE